MSHTAAAVCSIFLLSFCFVDWANFPLCSKETLSHDASFNTLSLSDYLEETILDKTTASNISRAFADKSRHWK